MNEYLLINKEGKVFGTSSIKTENCVKANFKPFCRDIARWNGAKLVYDFPKVEHKETKHKETINKLIFFLGGVFTSSAVFYNGTEIREHNGDISILIPCYKKSEYVMTAVKSCLKQTQKPKAVIVLLMDEESQKLKDELEGLSDIVTCYCEEQMNVSKARTWLAKKCKTDWLIFLDADDFLLRDYIKVLDSKKESFCMGMQSTISSKEFDVKLWNGDAFDLNKKEYILTQNMTALMHKDVFFDIGLKEKFASGGEDFDFLIRLGTSRKWSFSFESTPLWVYRTEVDSSLTTKDAYYESYLKVLLENKELLKETVYDSTYISPAMEQLLWFIDNPKKENFRKLAVFKAFCNRNESKENFYSDFDFLEDYIRNEFDYALYESMNRDTDAVFNLDDYEAVNCTDWDKTHLYNSEVQNSAFDAIIFNIDTNDVEKLILEPLSYVVRKDIQKEIEKNKLSNIDTLFYLLKNYSCFIKNDFGGNYPRRLLSQEDKFVTALGDIHFDKVAEESAQFIKDTLTFGLFTTRKEKVGTHKRSITFVLHKKCNLNCKYCPQSDKSDPLTDDEIFANFDKALTRFENELDEKFNIQIMGGETTLWSDYLQKKILERCKEYKFIHIFTNGANKSCPLYSENVIKHLHLIDWKNQINNKPLPKELYDLIVEDNDEEGLKILKNYKGTTKLHILPQKANGCSDLRMSYNFLKKLADIDNPLILNNHIKNFVREVEEGGYENARSICRNGTRPVIEVDCTRMTVRPCSNSKFEYSFDEFDFSKLTPESECANCMFTY